MHTLADSLPLKRLVGSIRTACVNHQRVRSKYVRIFLLYAPRVKAHPRGSGQPRGHSRPQVVSPGSSRPNEESIQPSAHSRKAGGGTLIPAPKAHADARRPCVQPRTQFGNPSTPIGSQGPFWAGGQAPPIHRGDEHRGRASFMPSRGQTELNTKVSPHRKNT